MNNLIVIAIVLVVLLAIAVMVIGKKSRSGKNETSEKQGNYSVELIKEGRQVYRKVSHLLTEHEKNFYRNFLVKKFSNFQIMMKVKVTDVIQPVEGLKWNESKSALGTIDKWHFDFVIIDNEYQIIGAIELDDSSHDTQKRKDRDRKLDEACKNAGVTLYRYRMKKGAFVPV